MQTAQAVINVLETIRRWLGIAPAAPVQKDAFRQLNTVAPLKYGQKEAPAAIVRRASPFVCREAVLDRGEHIGGYEFALGRKLQSRMLEKSALIRRVYDDAMLRNLAPLGVSSLLGDRFSFIRLSADSLKNPLLKAFSHLNTVIMITPGTITENDLERVRADLLYLENIGVKHGWTIDRPRPEITEFLHEADFIEIETSALDGIQLKMMCRDFRATQKRPKLIACELQTSDDFNLCYHCGFDYFMGSFVSSRENWHPAKSEINRIRVFEVLNMIRSGAEFDVIAARLRTEPILTFKLLRYINSPGIGLLQKIDEIQHALVFLGRDLFYRWLSLLLFDFNQLGYRERVLNEQALTRARFMQMLAGRGRVPAAADQLFITGLFSLLDVMMGQPLVELLKQVSLPESVASALKGEPGPMRDALLLGIAVESGAGDEMAAVASLCGLDAREVTSLMIEALAWSQQVISAGE
jgi:EAL and modified HD-GYP domain-containing signal transduction protein